MHFFLRISPLRISAVLILVAMGLWSVLTGQVFTSPGDSLIQHIPARTFSASTYLQGHFPLWNPYEDSGLPHAALVQPGVFYLPNAILYAILPPGMAYNLSLAFHYLLAAFFMRRYLQSVSLSRDAVTLGTVAFTLCGFMLHNGFVATFDAAVWIPAVFYCIEKWIQTARWRYSAWAGVCVAMPLLAGWPQLLLLSAFYAAIYGLVALREVRDRTRYLLGFLMLFVVTVCLVLPQVILTWEFKSHTNLQALDWPLFASASFPPQLLGLQMVFPCFFGAKSNVFYKISDWWGPPDFAILTVYAGILPLMLALAALPQCRVSRTIRSTTAVLVVALLLGFGAYTPIGRLLYHVPVFNFFHDHWISLAFFDFAIAVLAAHAVDKMDFPDLSSRLKRIWIIAIPSGLISLTAVMLIESKRIIRGLDPMISPLPGNWIEYLHKTVRFNDPAITIPVALVLFFALFFLYWTKHPRSRLIAGSAAVLVALDLLFFTFSAMSWHTPEKPKPEIQALFDAMRDRSKDVPFRVLTLQPNDTFLMVNANVLQGLEDIRAYEPFLPLPYSDFLDLTIGGDTGRWRELLVNNRILSLLDVRYLVATDQTMDTVRDILSPEAAHIEIGSSPSRNLIQDDNWKNMGGATTLGAVNSFASDGTSLSGINYGGNIALQRNTLYEFTFNARTEPGPTKDLFAMLYGTDGIQFCAMKAFMLSTTYRANTCLYLAPDVADPKLTIKFGTVSAAEIQVANVRLTAVAPLPMANRQYQLIKRSGSRSLLENRVVLPRAYFVNAVHPVHSYSDARSQLWQMSEPLDLRETALVENPGSDLPVSLGEGTVQELRYGPNEAKLRVACSSQCFLVLSDSYFPGWHAFVDGQETTIYRTNAVVRGIYVPSGRHSVRFVYRPPWFDWGLAAACFGLVLVGFITLRDRGKEAANSD